MRRVWGLVLMMRPFVIMAQTCGDGIKQPDEECDDGGANSDKYGPCLTTCKLKHINACGNAAIDPGEDCDDGNQVNDDGCTNGCEINACGNGLYDPDEECDDGNRDNLDSCHDDCRVPRCGDGILDQRTGEVCDDGNTKSYDYCSASCKKKTVPSQPPAQAPKEPTYAPPVTAAVPKSPGLAFVWSLACAGFCPIIGASAGHIYARNWNAAAASFTFRFIGGFGIGFSLARENVNGVRFWASWYAANELTDILAAPYSAKKYNRKWFGVDQVPGALRVIPTFNVGGGTGAALQLKF